MKTKTNVPAHQKKKDSTRSVNFFSLAKGFSGKSQLDSQLDFLYTQTSEYWNLFEKKHLLSLFQVTTKEVTAYRSFLKENSVNPNKIKKGSDLALIPPMGKDSYLRAYAWESLCKKNVLTKESLVMTSTSGSTGAPFYFPRSSVLDLRSALYHQMFIRHSKLKISKSTLIIDCFAMGVWIGGVLTYQAFKHIGESGLPLTIIAPGVNKKEIYDALRNLGPHYDQIILCGYPPFMKDVVDEAHSHGITWSDFNLRMVFAAEGFSETFRDYMLKKTGMKNIYRDTMNIYGSADCGTMAEETPICILIRRLAIKNIALYTKLFGQASRLPTLTQYIPSAVTFEAHMDRVYVSSDTVLPLIRYEIGDNGGVFTWKQFIEICGQEGVDIWKEIKKVGIEDTIAELPFVFVYERTDFSTKLYGAIIYPEYIKKGLQVENLEKYVTGKFTMYTKHNEQEDEYLEVNIELHAGINESEWLRHEVTSSISKSLIEKSAEHKNNVNMMPKGKVEPVIIFWPHEHESHFKSGGKHKWTKK